MESKIIILGVGNILYKDDGIGIRVIEKIMEDYEFPENVETFDGGVLGINLLGIISSCDHLIVIDSIMNKGIPGDLHRLEKDEIPNRIMSKTSLHQGDLLEALTVATLVPDGKVPETVIVGVEPENLSTLEVKLTDIVESKIDPLVDMVLKEMDRLEVSYKKRN